MENKVAKKSRLKIFLLVIAVIIFISLVSLIFILFNVKFNQRVYNNTYLNGQNISNMSPEELSIYVSNVDKDMSNSNIEIFQAGQKIYTVTPDMINASININDTVKQILAFGRDKGLFSNMISALSLKDKYFEMVVDYDKEKLDVLIKNIDLTINERVVYDSYLMADEGNKLILTRGKDGYIVDKENLAHNIISILSKAENSNLELKLIKEDSSILDSDRIIRDINREVKDAYIDDTTFPVTFVKEQYGISVDENLLKSEIENLKKLTEGESMEVSLNITEPKVFLSDIKYDMYIDKLSSYTTYFAGNQISRSKNIEIASKYINEQIIMPGEVFSFNNTVGEITKEKGYVNAATFQGGKVVDGIGGGICQVSSTLYNTVLLANLEIVERYAHSLPVSYVLPGRDATIYVGALDFKFKNSRNYPIKIVTSYSRAGNLTISIYGTKEDVEYDIEIESNVLKEIDFTTEYIYDSSMSSTEETIIQSGTNGIVSEAYIVKKLNNKEVERKLLSTDTYSTVSKIVKTGTK